MIDVLYLFPKAIDPAALDQFLMTNLIPGLKQAQGMLKVHISSGDLMSTSGPPPYRKVASFTFDSLESLFAYLQSPVGLPTVEFLESTATLILYYDVDETL
jgi:hypothetical protein